MEEFWGDSNCCVHVAEFNLDVCGSASAYWAVFPFMFGMVYNVYFAVGVGVCVDLSSGKEQRLPIIRSVEILATSCPQPKNLR